jgi:hypothetical protein
VTKKRGIWNLEIEFCVTFNLHQKNYVAVLRLAGAHVGFLDPGAIVKETLKF